MNGYEAIGRLVVGVLGGIGLTVMALVLGMTVWSLWP